MNIPSSRRGSLRKTLGRFGAPGYLLLLAVLALAGPYGIWSWSESRAVLESRERRIAALNAERDELKNLVARLNPERVDPDLATELVRRDLNVAHPDEYVLELEQPR
jgi:cell division protein FtsB